MKEHYHSPTMADWTGRYDGTQTDYFYQTIEPMILTSPPSEKLSGYALLGFACDLGVVRNQGRAGAKEGPQAIKQALAKLPAIHAHSIYDAGDIVADESGLQVAQTALGNAVCCLLDRGLFPIVLGGGHETAFGHYQGLMKHSGNQAIHIVNIDAHFDLRPIPDDQIGHSGTSFKQIAEHCKLIKQTFNYYCIGIQSVSNTASLFETAKALGVHTLPAEQIFLQGSASVEDFLKPVINSPLPVYLSICLDAFAACYAPGVSSPQPLGIFPWHIIPALKKLVASGNIIAMDMVELAPCFDKDGLTAKLAAQLLWNLLYY
ncbi:MAG: formimidoylglutamase [Legionellales bacterium]|nr:formimidoylglutamase [Legionellales bacterium]